MNICFINLSIHQRPQVYGLTKHWPDMYSILVSQLSTYVNQAQVFRLRKGLYVKYVASLSMPIYICARKLKKNDAS